MGARSDWDFDYARNPTEACHLRPLVPRLQSLDWYLLAVVCMACLHSTTLGPRITLVPAQLALELFTKNTDPKGRGSFVLFLAS